jgi:hypothetical protein
MGIAKKNFLCGILTKSKLKPNLSMKKLMFLPVLFLCMAVGIKAYSQAKPVITFVKMEHDYGKLKESDGKASYRFEFTNTGKAPLVVTDVKASCGCTSNDWTKEPIMAGKKGFVSAVYDPKDRPGPFNKTINVNSNAPNSPVVLTIKGDVVPREKTVEDLYPQKIGDLRMKTNHVAFQRITNTIVRTDTLEVINSGAKAIAITFDQVPQHITMKAVPDNLKPGAKGKILCTYDATKKGDYGFLIDRIALVVDGKNDATNRENRITISAEIEDDFSKLTPEQRANAPKIEFESKTFDFGTINEGENREYEFKFKNTGKSDLIIRKTKASCGCTVVDPADKIIAPGKTSSLKATFNSRGKSGKQNKSITVITNDPDNSSVDLRVIGTVNKVEETPKK